MVDIAILVILGIGGYVYYLKKIKGDQGLLGQEEHHDNNVELGDKKPESGSNTDKNLAIVEGKQSSRDEGNEN